MDKCKECKELDCQVSKIIWDGSTLLRLMREDKNYLKNLKDCQVTEIRFSLSMKDYWDKNDFKANRILKKEIK